MIVVRLMGGLGNQMFQYATGMAVAIRNSTMLKTDITFLEANKLNPHEVNTHRDLDLQIFELEVDHATKEEIEYFNGKQFDNFVGKVCNRLLFSLRKKNLVIEKGRAFHPELLKLKDNKCLAGAWQSEKYFKDVETEIRKTFKFRNRIEKISQDLVAEINNNESVCVNVRRGDYITSPIYRNDIGALTSDYYNKGISFLENKLKDPFFYIFSDDVEWCKKNLRSDRPIKFVGHEHAGERFGNYLQLMSHCKHFVISNSTFAWWGAFLGEIRNGIVIAPKVWTRMKQANPVDILPDRWIKLENAFEPND